jgi:biotin carboxyl carrier protein
VRYYVTLGPDPGQRPVLVDLVEGPGGALEVRVEGEPVDVDALELGGDPTQLTVRVRSQIVDLTTEGATQAVGLGAVASGLRPYVRVESERMRSAEQAKRSTVAGGDTVVRSPMPGRVVKVLVAEGDRVETGQGLLVLEAMKMENEVRARIAGTVAAVHVSPGATVDGQAKLVTLV